MRIGRGFSPAGRLLFEVFTVGFVECGQLVAVDVEHAPHFSCGYHRHDDFGTGEGTAGNVPGELVYIGHELVRASAQAVPHTPRPFLMR